MNPAPDRLSPLRRFVADMTRLVERKPDEPQALAQARPLLQALIDDDSWLPAEYGVAAPGEYRQYLLHCDPLERFSVVSFVWGPGARTPIHDHTVWGLVGVMRGAERCEEFDPQPPSASVRVRPRGTSHVMKPGMIDAVSPTIGDWHVVANELTTTDSVSIHVYGANIGAVRRHRYDPDRDAIVEFISGYSRDSVPNLWDRSAALRADAGR